MQVDSAPAASSFCDNDVGNPTSACEGSLPNEIVAKVSECHLLRNRKFEGKDG